MTERKHGTGARLPSREQIFRGGGPAATWGAGKSPKSNRNLVVAEPDLSGRQSVPTGKSTLARRRVRASLAPRKHRPMSQLARRKNQHLDLAVEGDVGFKHTRNLFECVRLVHDALPELALDTIDLSCSILGKRLRAPLLIAGMTGGTDRAAHINRELAAVAEARGYAFGLGSQRPMLEDESVAESYQVRDVAPSVLLLEAGSGAPSSATSTWPQTAGLTVRI